MASPSRTSRTAVTLGVVVATLAIGSVLAGQLLGVGDFMNINFAIQTALFGAALGTVAAMGLPQQPRNRALRLLLVFGAIMALEVSGFLVTGLMARAQLEPSTYAAFLEGELSMADLPTAIAVVLWVPFSIWLISLGGFLTYGLLLFPDGRLPGPRWRVVGLMGGVGIGAVTLGYVLGFHPWSTTPLGEWVASGPLGVVMNVGFLLTALAMLGSVASLVSRYRQADADGRHQIRWVGFGAATVVAFLVVAVLLPVVLSEVDLQIANAVSMLAVPILVGSYAIAVLRYRLYDIDVVLSRTLVFGALAVFITGVYVAVVVGLGGLLGRGDEPDLALSIAATALVAVAFEPVRARVHRWANRLVFGRRATPYDVLAELTGRLSAEPSDRTLDRVAELLRAGTGATRTVVWLRVADHLLPAATAGDGPILATTALEDLTIDQLPGDRTVAVEHDGELLGALSVSKARGDTITPADERLLEDTAAGASLVLRNLRLQAELTARAEELRASRHRLVAAQDETRRRIERDLHDGAQQNVVALKVKVSLARTIAAREATSDGLPEELDRLSQQTQHAIDSLRALAHGIYPPLLEAEGLRAAISHISSLRDVAVSIDAPAGRRYPRDVEATVYFAVAEALNNAHKHGRPTSVRIGLAETDGGLSFRVSDDGVGFDPDTTSRGTGLATVVDRIDALDGHVELRSSPGAGAELAGWLPIAADQVDPDRPLTEVAP